MRLVPLTEEVADLAVALRQTTRLKLPDAIIYATAKAEKAVLLTANTKDFHGFAADVVLPY